MDENDPFETVQSYDDLLSLNQSFLDGGIYRTPYHHGPIDFETRELVDALHILHHYQFLSVCSQPARTTQKAFIEGYLPRTYVPAWIAFFKERYAKSYFCKMYRFERSRSCGAFLCSGPPDRVRSRLVYDTFPLGVDYIVTLFETDARVCSTIPPGAPPHPADDFYGYHNIQSFLIADTVKMILAHRDFGKGGAEMVLIDFFSTQSTLFQ